MADPSWMPSPLPPDMRVVARYPDGTLRFGHWRTIPGLPDWVYEDGYPLQVLADSVYDLLSPEFDPDLELDPALPLEEIELWAGLPSQEHGAWFRGSARGPVIESFSAYIPDDGAPPAWPDWLPTWLRLRAPWREDG